MRRRKETAVNLIEDCRSFCCYAYLDEIFRNLAPPHTLYKHKLSGALVNSLSAVKYRQIEERAAEVARYIVDNNATVRQAAKAFGISKSTIHMVVTK